MKLTHPPSRFLRGVATRCEWALPTLAVVLTLFAGVQKSDAQGTAFSYQGGLSNSNTPANGNFDFAFELYNDPQNGGQVGAAETNLAVIVADGLFTATVDFGSAPWNGESLWLQVFVRTNGAGAFSLLKPRQAMTSSPYAIQSLNAATAATASTATIAGSASSVAATNLTGTILNAALPSSPVFSGTVTAKAFTGNGGGITNLNPTNLANGTAAINISGNAATANSASNVTGHISDSQLSANVPLLNGTNSFAGTNIFAGVLVATNTNNVINGTLTGSVSGNATTAVTASNFTGSLSGDVTGTQSATIVASVGGQLAGNVASGVSAANSATSANISNTIVLRDASGNFAAGSITGGFLIGDGSAVTNLNPTNFAGGTAAINISGIAATATTASNVTGEISDFQLSTNVAFLDGTNGFTGTNNFTGLVVATNTNNIISGTFTGILGGNATTAVTASNFSGSLTGDVIGTQDATTVVSVGGLSASNVAGGAIAANAATSANISNTIVLRDASGNFAGGAITAISLSGDGGAVTNLSPTNLTAGTAAIDISGSASNVTGNIADFQLSANVSLLGGTNSFTGTNNFAGVTMATNTNNVFVGAFTGSLAGNAATASSATSASTASSANNFTGSLLGQVVGTQGATTVVSVGGQSAANVASGASAANASTSLDTPSTIVKRDVTGSFSAGTVTATNFNGNGSGLTNLNAAQLVSTVNGNIDIGTSASLGDTNVIRIGALGTQTNAFIAGIYGVTAATGVAVFVNSSNQLGTMTSSRKYKQDIQTMNDASDALLALRPVTFRYKPEIDPTGLPQFGLVAEEVEKVDPDLVAHDRQGHPYTVRYEAVNAMLLNEFLKEHHTVETQASKIEELTQRLDRLEKAVSKTRDTANNLYQP